MLYYNVEFLSGKPVVWYVTENATEYNVDKWQYDLYTTGKYFKNERGEPELIESCMGSITLPSGYDELPPEIEDLYMAVAEMATDLELLKGE